MTTIATTAASTGSASIPTTLEESLRRLIAERRANRRNMDTQEFCRMILKSADRPFSVSEIVNTLERCGYPCLASTINITLQRMADVYIQDWSFAKRAGRPSALWRIVHVPKNAPPPDVLRSVFIR